MSKILIVGDTHAHPNHSNERFTWLGRYIVDSKPDKVVQIGDFADMPSLCSYDKGRRSFEGRRYNKDIAAAIDAQEKDRKSTRLNSSHIQKSRMPSSA